MAKREPRWNLKPLQYDGRSRKFAAAVVEKLEIEIEFSQNEVEECKNIKETITEVAKEQLMNNPVEIRKLRIMEHIIEHVEERRMYMHPRNETGEVLCMRPRNKSSGKARRPNELE
jgi:predicted nuclease of restriction endonuclease-like (RecB) superfamily